MTEGNVDLNIGTQLQDFFIHVIHREFFVFKNDEATGKRKMSDLVDLHLSKNNSFDLYCKRKWPNIGVLVR